MKIILTKLLGYFQIFISAGALAGGIQLIVVPDGSSMNLSTGILAGTPFTNFLIPGISLFTVIGLGNLSGAWLCLKNKKIAGIYGLFLGMGLIIWMLVQIILIGWGSWLQPFYLTLGTFELVLGLMLFKKVKTKKIHDSHKEE